MPSGPSSEPAQSTPCESGNRPSPPGPVGATRNDRPPEIGAIYGPAGAIAAVRGSARRNRRARERLESEVNQDRW